MIFLQSHFLTPQTPFSRCPQVHPKAWMKDPLFLLILQGWPRELEQRRIQWGKSLLELNSGILVGFFSPPLCKSCLNPWKLIQSLLVFSWNSDRKSFGILWTVRRWNFLPLTPYFPYTFLEPNFLLAPRFVESQHFCDAPGAPAGEAWLFLMEWCFYWSMQVRDDFFGIKAGPLEGRCAAIPALCHPHKCWGEKKRGDHRRSLILNSGLTLTRLWVYIRGLLVFPAHFCCWLRSLDRVWEFIPLNLKEKPGEKTLTAPRRALALPSRRSQINLLNPFMAPAGKSFSPSWNILWSHPSVFCIPLLSLLVLSLQTMIFILGLDNPSTCAFSIIPPPLPRPLPCVSRWLLLLFPTKIPLKSSGCF